MIPTPQDFSSPEEYLRRGECRYCFKIYGYRMVDEKTAEVISEETGALKILNSPIPQSKVKAKKAAKALHLPYNRKT